MSDVAQLQQQVKGLNAQLDAAKQMINESLTTSLQLRSNLNLLSATYSENLKKNAELEAKIKELTPKEKVAKTK